MSGNHDENGRTSGLLTLGSLLPWNVPRFLYRWMFVYGNRARSQGSLIGRVGTLVDPEEDNAYCHTLVVSTLLRPPISSKTRDPERTQKGYTVSEV